MPMMTLEEMEAMAEKAAAVAEATTTTEESEVESDEGSTLDLYTCMWEALDIMKRCAIFFDYAADPVLVHNLTKQHRTMMNKLSNSIYDFAETVEEGLNNIEEDE